MLNTLLLKGLVTDIPAQDAPPENWNAAEGVNFRQGVAERFAGYREIYGGTTELPLHVRNNFFKDTNYWLYASQTKIRVVNAGGTHFNITPTSAPNESDPNHWTSCEINGLPVLNHTGGAPVYWGRNTGAVCADLPDWPASYTCEVIRAYREYLIALNVYDGASELPSLIKWSDAAAGGIPDDGAGTTWSATAANDSGELNLADTSEGIVDGGTLRDVFMIYKPHAMYQLYYVGNQAIFGLRNYSLTTGALSANCWSEWRGNHVVLTDGDLIINDGNTIQSIADGRVRRELFSSLDIANYEKAYLMTNPIQGEVWVCYPESGADFANRALVWNARHDAFSFRDLSIGGSGSPHAAYGNVSESVTGDTWSSISTNWNTETRNWDGFAQSAASDGLVGIDYDAPNLVALDVGTTQDTGSVNVVLQKLTQDFGDPLVKKLCLEIRPRIVGDAGTVIGCRVGTQDEPSEAISWGATVNYTIGTSQKVNVRARGRYLSFDFRTSDDATFRMTGFAVLVKGAGMYN